MCENQTLMVKLEYIIYFNMTVRLFNTFAPNVKTL